MEYMPSSFDRIFVAWTIEILIWEKPKTVLPNWYMIGDGLCSSGAQRIGVPKSLEPWSSFDVQQFDYIEVIV